MKKSKVMDYQSAVEQFVSKLVPVKGAKIAENAANIIRHDLKNYGSLPKKSTKTNLSARDRSRGSVMAEGPQRHSDDTRTATEMPKRMAGGGRIRGCGAATKGRNHSKKMG
jgi:hypothetical protein